MTVFPNIFAGPKGEGAEDMIVVGGGRHARRGGGPAQKKWALKK
jgi:hypothetical protein